MFEYCPYIGKGCIFDKCSAYVKVSESVHFCLFRLYLMEKYIGKKFVLDRIEQMP